METPTVVRLLIVCTVNQYLSLAGGAVAASGGRRDVPHPTDDHLQDWPSVLPEQVDLVHDLTKAGGDTHKREDRRRGYLVQRRNYALEYGMEEGLPIAPGGGGRVH